MHRTARRTYIAGSITFILIGVLHTLTQFTELSTPEVADAFTSIGTIPVSGQEPAAWDLFRGTSYLMGFFSLAIGCDNLATLRTVGRDALPPLAICITMVFTLIGVATMGVLFLGPLQLYGGLAGVVMFGLPLLAHVRA